MFDLTQWCYRRYEHAKKKRFYELHLSADLLDGWQVIKVFGATGTHQCQKQSHWFNDYQDALAFFQQQDEYRIRQRHYEPVAESDSLQNTA